MVIALCLVIFICFVKLKVKALMRFKRLTSGKIIETIHEATE
jgi:hypothetical protein